MPSLSTDRVAAASVLLLCCWCVSAAAQGVTDITGMWIVQDPGSGNWSDWYNNVPKPSLRPEIIKDNEAIAAREAAGEVVNRAARLANCPFGNLPMMMASSPPLNIVQSREEILIGAEANRGRFIYTDGQRPRRPKHSGRRRQNTRFTSDRAVSFAGKRPTAVRHL